MLGGSGDWTAGFGGNDSLGRKNNNSASVNQLACLER
jgi:hypothetical protein